MLHPLEKVIDGKTYILSKFPAVAGREIVTQYPLSAVPKLGDYHTNEEMMYKILSFVGVPLTEGKPMLLTTKDLVNNHVPSWETLLKIEWEMMEYNCSFFRDGRVANFFDGLAQNIPQWITQIAIPWLRQLSQSDSQPTKSSKKTTR